MKANTLDLILYLFDNYMEDDSLVIQRQAITEELLEAGFRDQEIDKVFSWIEALAQLQNIEHAACAESTGVRYFTEKERERLKPDAIGFLMHLEKLDIIDTMSRETIIEQAMKLDGDPLDSEAVQWISFMVLMNLPGHEESLERMETFASLEPSDTAH